MVQPEVVASTAVSVDASLRRALLAAAVVWQLTMIATVLASHTRIPASSVVGAHVVAAVVALGAMRRTTLYGPVMVAMESAFFLDCLAAPSLDSALCLAACWQGDLLNLLPGALWRGRSRYLVPIASVLVVSVGLVLVRADWPASLSGAFVVTTLAMVGAVQVGLPQLRRLGDWADHEEDRAEEERRAVVAAARAGQEAAEDARTLHDTVINTLGAVASGGAAVRDVEAVRQRCNSDMATIGGLLAGRGAPAGGGLAEMMTRPVGIRGRRSGLDDAELRRLEALLPVDASRALTAATAELILNAAKHSGAPEVVVDVAFDGSGLRVTVCDDGIGFSGVVIEGRGLAESVVARLDGVGGQFRLKSARGAGTSVELVCDLTGDHRPTDPAEQPAASALIGEILRRAFWLWAVGTLGVGVVIEVANRPGELTATYGMLAITAAVVASAWWACRDGRELPWRLAALAIVAVPASFVLALAGVGFGDTCLPTYQAIGFVPLLVLLLVLRRGRRALWLALGSLGATVVVLSVVQAARISQDAALIVVVAAAPAFGLVAAWSGFVRLVVRLVAASRASRLEAFRARSEIAERQAVVAARARWRHAEARSAEEILAGLAEGRLDPRRPEVQAMCGAEETYLRQLIQLSPEAFRISGWLARGLAEARGRAVLLTVRTAGDVDAPDEDAARALGAVILGAVRTAPSHSALAVGLFVVGQGRRLTLVGTRSLLEEAARWASEPGWRVTTTELGAQNLVEVDW